MVIEPQVALQKSQVQLRTTANDRTTIAGLSACIFFAIHLTPLNSCMIITIIMLAILDFLSRGFQSTSHLYP